MSGLVKIQLKNSHKTISQLSPESSPIGCLVESINASSINDLLNTQKIAPFNLGFVII